MKRSKLRTRDVIAVFAVIALSAATLIHAFWVPAWDLESGLKCDACILSTSTLDDGLTFSWLSGAHHEFVLDGW